ncbi:MAG: hypothetical protein ACI3XT_02480, partial [Butyricicoccaceae bacterium]
DRYNVFQADSLPAMLVGDPLLTHIPGGAIGLMAASMSGVKPEGRQRQLPALFAVAPDGTIKYAYYGKTLSDMPKLDDAVRALME